MATGRGSNAYVLCGSTANTEAVRECFRDADGCIAIDNPLEFANAVSFGIPHFNGGAGGHCIYQDDTVIRRHSDDWKHQDFSSGSMDDLRRLADTAGGVEELFIKHSRFAPQAEYRMLWASAAPMQDFITVKVPAARQFCRRM
jgi:hypothetical protein